MMNRPRPEPGKSLSGDDRFLLWSFVVFAFALAVRILHLLLIQEAPFYDLRFGDAAMYDAWARSIMAGNWLGDDVFYQAPLYPYFLAVLYKVMGDSVPVVRFSQAVLGAISCAFLARAGWRFFSKPVGIVAGIALAVYAPTIFFDTLLQKSVLDLFFLSLCLWLLAELQAKPRESISLALGLAMGALALTRENALVLIAPIVVWLVVHHCNEGRRSLTLAAAFLVGIGTVLLPVAARNRIAGGEFHLTTSQFGPNLYIGNNADADGAYRSLRPRRGDPKYERQDATELAEEALGRKLTPSEVSSYYLQRVVDYVRSEPGPWMRLLLRKAILSWNAVEVVDTEDQYTYGEWSPLLRLAGRIFHFGILGPLAVFGAWITWGERHRLWVLHLMILLYAASLVVFYVFARYRLPLVPLLMLLAAPGLVYGRSFFRRASPREAAATVAVTLGMAVLANWPMLDRTQMQAMTHYNIAVALERAGRLDEALDHYGRCLELHPSLSNAHYNLGNLLSKRGRVGEAVEHLREAVRLEPSYAEANNNLGNLLLEIGEDEEAAIHLEQAVELSPDNAQARNNLGNLLVKRGDFVGAAREYKEALRIDPNYTDAHYNLGNVFFEQRELARAIEEYEEALRLDPAHAQAHNNLGVVYAFEGEMDLAALHFERVLEIDPENIQARENLSRARRKR